MNDKLYQLIIKKIVPILDKIKNDPRKKILFTAICVTYLVALILYMSFVFTFENTESATIEFYFALGIWPSVFMLGYLYKKPKNKKENE